VRLLLTPRNERFCCSDGGRSRSRSSQDLLQAQRQAKLLHGRDRPKNSEGCYALSEPALITCPCCGYKTITTEGDICVICRWEHNTYQEEVDPDDDGGPNYVSFRVAQRNFARFGVSDEAVLKNARRTTADDVRDPNWKPLSSPD